MSELDSRRAPADTAPCMWMRGGTSKGGYFLADDLPQHKGQRDAFLLHAMGSPDPRQIDGMGGADPLTSKVAVVRPSRRKNVDVDYLFLQVFVDRALVSDAQNCGNILAGVGPFAIERGLVAARDPETRVCIYMENTDQIAEARVRTPGSRVSYRGSASIDGVPGTASPIPLTFRDTAGSSCGDLLPTGNVADMIGGVRATCIDNGMPTVIVRAADMGIAGTENREALDSDSDLKRHLDSIRLEAGPLMNLGDVADKSVPKMSMVSAAKAGGTINTRTFIPHRCHASIGVLGAVSVATACTIEGSVANELARLPDQKACPGQLDIEHPAGRTTVVLNVDSSGQVKSAGILRTARKLFDGEIFAEA